MPKKGKKKGKAADLTEPDHDKTWERAVDDQEWIHEPTLLPDAFTWPTWGALRERILQACKVIKCEHTATVRDAFPAELVKLSPSELHTLSFSGCPNLHNLIMSPETSCPLLTTLCLANCTGLNYVLIQSMSLQTIDLRNCPEATKVLIYAPNALKIIMSDCPKLETIRIWSEQLTELNMDGCTGIKELHLDCEKLENFTPPPLIPPPRPVRPQHPFIHKMISSTYKGVMEKEAARKEAQKQLLSNHCKIADVYRGIGAVHVHNL